MNEAANCCPKCGKKLGGVERDGDALCWCPDGDEHEVAEATGADHLRTTEARTIDRSAGPDAVNAAIGAATRDGAVLTITANGKPRMQMTPGKAVDPCTDYPRIETKFTIEGESPVRPVSWRAVGPWRSDFRMAQSDAAQRAETATTEKKP